MENIDEFQLGRIDCWQPESKRWKILLFEKGRNENESEKLQLHSILRM